MGADLVRTYVRSVDTESLPATEAVEVARLRRGMNALTGRARVLGGRYGDLTFTVRDAGGSVFDWVDNTEARRTVQLLAGSNREPAGRIAERSRG
ncbi:hypothetical protein [Arthrobacter sp. UYEF3]|uniref:hypothetical protein n=1 Tax=Arthrobacter sp. UYEF3 TaxID=1756365 RepID=UPI003399CC45